MESDEEILLERLGISGSSKLTQKRRSLIEDPYNVVFLSSIPAAEIAIKNNLGKLQLPEPPLDYIPRLRSLHRITELPLTERAALLVATLPLIHRDPFDRLLIAQSLSHSFPLITSDPLVHQYKFSLDQLQVF